MPPWISTRFVCRFLTRIQENKFGPPVIHAKVTFMDCFCYLDIKIRDLKDNGPCNQQSQSGLGMLTMKPKPYASVSLLVGSYMFHGAGAFFMGHQVICRIDLEAFWVLSWLEEELWQPGIFRHCLKLVQWLFPFSEPLVVNLLLKA